MIDQTRVQHTLWRGIRGICFDLGGTLIRPEVEPTTGQVAQVLGLSLEEARAVMADGAKRRRISPKDLAHELAVSSRRPALIDPLTRVLQRAQCRAESPELFGDAAGALIALRQRGFMLFALTNSLGSSLPTTPPAALHRLLDRVVYSAEIGAIKPEREAFAAVEHASGLAPDQLLHVGDSLRADVVGASAAGWHVAWLDRRPPGGALCSAARTVRLHTLATLPLLLPAGPASALLMESEVQ